MNNHARYHHRSTVEGDDSVRAGREENFVLEIPKELIDIIGGTIK